MIPFLKGQPQSSAEVPLTLQRQECDIKSTFVETCTPESGWRVQAVVDRKRFARTQLHARPAREGDTSGIPHPALRFARKRGKRLVEHYWASRRCRCSAPFANQRFEVR
jgi:hypothetical protein